MKPAESRSVVDSSAILALLLREPGVDAVAEALQSGAAISTVNLSEVVAKLTERGMPDDAVAAALDPLGMQTVDFGRALAYQAGTLRLETRTAGLSLGDRACLALARELGLPAVTADRQWQDIDVGVEIRVIR